MIVRPGAPRLLRIAAIGCFFGVISLAVRAHADERATVEKVTDLNRKGLAAYENLEFDEARTLLKEALDLCASAGLDKHKMKARTHVHLGIVLIAGFKQKDQGLKQFAKALEIQPDIGLTKSVANPELQAAFDEAKASAGRGSEAAAPSAPPAGRSPSGEARETPPEDISGLFHETVGEANQAESVEIKAAVGADIEFETVMLAYRAKSASDFLAREMTKNDKGWFVAEIPAEATNADVVSYYIEVRNKDGQPVAANGSARTPNIVALSGESDPGSGLAQATGEEESDEEGEEGEEGEEEEEEEEEESSGGRSVFFGIAFGSGIGYAQGRPEVNIQDGAGNMVETDPGLATAQLLHVAPEFGVFLGPELALSVQARLQIVSGPNDVQDFYCPGGDGDARSVKGTCKPSPGAFAVLGKLTWFFGQKDFTPYFHLAVGGGHIRHVVNLGNVLQTCGPNEDQDCVDTVRAGVFLAGPGLGFFYKLGDSLSLNVGSNILLGAPDFTLNADLNLGVAFAL